MGPSSNFFPPPPKKEKAEILRKRHSKTGMAERVSHLPLGVEEQPASRLPRQTRVVGAAAVVVAGALAVCTLAPGPGARLPPVLAQAQQQSWGRGAGRTAERNRALQSLAQLQWGGHARAKRTLVQLDNMAAGAGSPIYQQAQDEQTNDPGALGEPTKSMDDMPDDVKAMFAQASSEQESDPAFGGNTTDVNEVPDSIQQWFDDMKKKVAIDPTKTIDVTVEQNTRS